MANVLFIAVRQDIERAETLADMFEMAGVGVISPFNDDTLEACDAAILVWSHAASRSAAFVKAAEHAAASGKALSACLAGAPASVLASASAFNLSKWNGAPESGALDDFFYAAYSKLMAAQRAASAETAVRSSSVANDNPDEEELPGPVIWEDAEFEPVQTLREKDADAVLDRGWSAPLPDKPLPTYTDRRFATERAEPAPPVRKRHAPFGMFTLPVIAAIALIGATAFGAMQLNARAHTAERSGLAAMVDQGNAFASEPGEDMADVAPPVWGREPASAPEMAETI